MCQLPDFIFQHSLGTQTMNQTSTQFYKKGHVIGSSNDTYSIMLYYSLVTSKYSAQMWKDNAVTS